MKQTTTNKKASAAKKKNLSPSGKKLSSRSNAPKTQPRSTKKASVAKYPAKEIRIICLLFSTIVLILSYYFNAFGIVGTLLKNASTILFGGVCFAIPPILLIATVHMFMKGTLSPHIHRYVFASLCLVCISGLNTLYYTTVNPALFSGENSFFVSLLETTVYSGKMCESGGILGALVSLPLRALVSTTGASVILVCLSLVCVVTFTGTEPFTRFARFVSTSLKDYFLSLSEKRSEKEEQAEKEKNDGSFVKINMPEEAPPSEKKKKKRSAEQHSEETHEEAKESAEFKINLYNDKNDKKESAPLSLEKVEIPEEIREAALKESGGIEEEKPDMTPIEVTDDEMDFDHINYTFPPIDLLTKSKRTSEQDKPEDLRAQAKKLVDTLHSFGVEAKVLEVSKGPSVTRFELQPSAGVKVSKIVNLADDIALNLAAFGVRIEAPIPGKAAVGIEIPNKNTSMVCLRDVIESEQFQSFPSKTAFAMGKDIAGMPVISDISKMPHMLIAGATGSGKSVCINSLITSILYKADPNEVKLILIDPKVVELGVYNGIPHLLIPVVTDPRRAAGALNWAVQEMVKRYSMFATANVRDIKGYNEYAAMSGERELEQIIIVIDELADLMMVSPHEVEDSICRLAQMARAAGMHLVIATQRPSVDVITGLIKANVPSRIAFSVSSQIDSRTILDMGGAEKLLGKGDMLFLPMGASKPKRLQGAFVSDKEIERIVEFVKADSSAHYNEDIIEHIENGTEEHQVSDDTDADDLLPQAIEIVVEIGQASASLLQRKLKVGYSRAGRLIDQLEERGIIGPHEGSKPRKVLMSKSEFQEMTVNNLE